MQSKFTYTPLSSVVDHTTRSVLAATMQDDTVSFGEVANQIYDTVTDTHDRTKAINAVSLFSYIKSTIISSRMYLEDTLVDESILPNLTRNLLNLYVGIVITAIGLDKFVAGGRTVRETLALVATESFDQKLADVTSKNVAELMSDYFLPTGSKRHLSESVLREFRSIMMDEQSGNPPAQTDKANVPQREYVQHSEKEVTETTRTEDNFNSKALNLASNKDVELPCTAIIQLDLDTNSLTRNSVNTDKIDNMVNNPEGDDSIRTRSATTTEATKNSKLNILVQLRPAFIPTTVMRAFVDLNFVPTRFQRYIQARTGEIRFFQDFVLGCDLGTRYRRAMRDDKTGILKEMLENQASSLNRHYTKIGKNILRASSSSGVKSSVNIANTILIFDRKSFDTACSAAGISFKNPSVRESFFDKTYAMIVVIVDPSFGRVEMFYNGITQGSTFTYRQLAINAKSEATDLVSIMRTYASGMAPKI